MNDFEVREMAGVYGDQGGAGVVHRWIQLRELEAYIKVTVGDHETYISVADARKLANQLRRLALRIEKRIVVK